ncbi:glycine receptor subunit alpha-1-like [Convolutriloba macropyga]|uniref:glycine receptor subunit alpha-1-like n=1 Tax=Convolutriloba macropyga TaxID=536237 RepID=UPI003F521178
MGISNTFSSLPVPLNCHNTPLSLVTLSLVVVFVHTYMLTDPEYNRQVRPNEGGSTDEVEIGMFTNSIRTVSEFDMTIVLDVFLQASWKDERLISTWHSLYRNIHGFNYSDCTNLLCNDSRITMGREFANEIWKPDFYLAAATQIVPADNYNDNVCVRFDIDGTLFYSSRFIISHSCPMSMGFFPFDQHTCLIRIGTYKYHDGLVRMLYSVQLSGMYPNQETANFIFADFHHDKDYMNSSMPYMDDIFTEHWIYMHMTRKYQIFLVTLYLPSVSLVALSWVNFWIDPKAIPARAGLSITAILAQITLIVGMAQRFPSVSDLKMADLYLTVNFMYTFATLIEFAVVSYQPQEKKDAKKKKKQKKNCFKSLLSSKDDESSFSRQNKFNPDHSPLLSNGNAVVLSDGTTLRVPVHSRSQGPCCSKSGPNSSSSSHHNVCTPGCSHSMNKSPLNASTRSLTKKAPPPKQKYNIDHLSKLCFPSTFIVWNIIFFSLNIQLAGRYDVFGKLKSFLPG